MTADSPRGVDPDDADVAEENALFVFLVLAGAAFLSPVGRVGELRPGALLRCGAGDGEGGGCGAQEEEEVRYLCKLPVDYVSVPDGFMFITQSISSLKSNVSLTCR